MGQKHGVNKKENAAKSQAKQGKDKEENIEQHPLSPPEDEYRFGLSSFVPRSQPCWESFGQISGNHTLDGLMNNLNLLQDEVSRHGIVITFLPPEQSLYVLTTILTKYPTLGGLDLYISSISDSYFAALEQLIKNSKLQFLAIRSRSIDDPQKLWSYIARAIKDHRYLVELSSSGNYNGMASGFIKLCEGLKVNKSIKTLRVNKCYLYAEEWTAFQQVLKVNTTLRNLLAQDNYDYEPLMEALQLNTTLWFIDVGSDFLGAIMSGPKPRERTAQTIMRRNERIASVIPQVASLAVLMLNALHNERTLPPEIWLHIFSYVSVLEVSLNGLVDAVKRGTIQQAIKLGKRIRFTIMSDSDVTVSFEENNDAK